MPGPFPKRPCFPVSLPRLGEDPCLCLPTSRSTPFSVLPALPHKECSKAQMWSSLSLAGTRSVASQCLRPYRPTGTVLTLHYEHAHTTWARAHGLPSNHDSNKTPEKQLTLVKNLWHADYFSLKHPGFNLENDPVSNSISLILPVRKLRPKEAITGNEGQNRLARPLCSTGSHWSLYGGLCRPRTPFPSRPLPQNALPPLRGISAQASPIEKPSSTPFSGG